MAEEDSIRRVLEDHQRRHIAVFCILPRSSDEILGSVKEIWKDYDAKTLATDLSTLESYGAAIYEGDKWKTTDIAKTVLKKYYGVKV